MDPDIRFADIRPYRDHEFRSVIDRMLGSPLADILITSVFPGKDPEIIKHQLRKITTIKQFQENIIYKALKAVLSASSSSCTQSGLENLTLGQNYLFISNHRDIILDPSILNMAIIQNGFETAEVAIGDNLLEKPWVKDLARLNKSFIVKRNLSVRELVSASNHLSEYIKEVILNRKQSVWIAQREGRAKDGNDRTQAGVLNMIGLCTEVDLKSYFVQMNIIPVSVSYQKDPCDVDKVRSLYSLKYFGGYTKEKNEDNLAMRKGIMGDKGNIHIHFGKPLSSEIEQLPSDLHKNELIAQIAQRLDREIIGNYKPQKSNYIAYDLTNEDSDLSMHYSAQDRLDFLKDIDSKIETMAGDPAELKRIFLEIYTRPYQNKLELVSTL